MLVVNKMIFYIYSRISISRLLDKSNSRCIEQNNRSHPYKFTQNDYSISRILDVSNKFVGPLTVRSTVDCTFIKNTIILFRLGYLGFLDSGGGPPRFCAPTDGIR